MVSSDVSNTNEALWLLLLVTGSSGIGKSVLTVLFYTYLAVYHDFHILLLRSVKRQNGKNTHDEVLADAVLWFRGGHITKYPGIERKDLPTLIAAFKAESRARQKQYLVVGDGYLQSDIQNQESLTSALASCHIITTSAQFRIKDDDGRVALVVPAWSQEALHEAHKHDKAIVDTFDERYSLAGGSIRIFGLSPTRHRAHVTWHLSLQAIDALAKGADADKDVQIDALRRTYIQNIDKYEHYVVPIYRQRIVDSFVVQRLLLTKTTLAFFSSMVGWAEISINRTLYGWLFEALVHKLATDRVLKIELTAPESNSADPDGTSLTVEPLPVLELDFSVCSVVTRGKNTDDCLDYLKKQMCEDTYWAPEFPRFPAVDAIAAHNNTIYYFQMTVATTHAIHDAIETIHGAFNDNDKLKHYDHMFVFVTPPQTQWTGTATVKIGNFTTRHGVALNPAGALCLLSLK